MVTKTPPEFEPPVGVNDSGMKSSMQVNARTASPVGGESAPKPSANCPGILAPGVSQYASDDDTTCASTTSDPNQHASAP